MFYGFLYEITWLTLIRDIETMHSVVMSAGRITAWMEPSRVTEGEKSLDPLRGRGFTTSFLQEDTPQGFSVQRTFIAVLSHTF